MSSKSKRTAVARAQSAAATPAKSTPATKPARRSRAVRVRAQDEHGFDPDDYDWLPVPRRKRADGWTPEKQRDFIGHLADTGSVRRACKRLGLAPSSAYRLRRSPEGAGFAAAWDAAVREAALGLLDDCSERARYGFKDPIWKDGEIIGYRQRYSDQMAMFLLRKQLPDRFGDLHRDRLPPDGRGRSNAAPAPRTAPHNAPQIAPPTAPQEPMLPSPVAATLLRLGPVKPADPVAASDPDLLDLSLARLASGRMPPGLELWTHPDDRTEHQGYRPEHEAMIRAYQTGKTAPDWLPPPDHDDLCADED